jgi:hypothetical protein
MTEIRSAAPSDADTLFPLVAAFATSFQPERPAFAASFNALLGHDDALLLVAQAAEDLVGTYSVSTITHSLPMAESPG